MKIGVIIPDRGDRPKLLDNCLKFVHNEEPEAIWVINSSLLYPSISVDITTRYKIGYEKLAKDVDIIAFIENDDYYRPGYLKAITDAWQESGEPDLFGINYTIYYHLRLRKYFKYIHPNHSSSCCTLIKPGLTIDWPKDQRFLDLYLWTTLPGKLWNPSEIWHIGIKGHGHGMSGGTGHVNKLFRYNIDDSNFDFLKANMNENHFNFWSKL